MHISGESPKVCDNLLFIHAILGCDSTSCLFGLWKGLALKKGRTDSDFLKQAKVFSQSKERVGKGIIIAAGEKALVSLYWGEKRWIAGYAETQAIVWESIKDHISSGTSNSSTNISSCEVPQSPRVLPDDGMERRKWNHESRRLEMACYRWEIHANNDGLACRTTGITGHSPLQLQDRLWYQKMHMQKTWTLLHCYMWRMPRY